MNIVYIIPRISHGGGMGEIIAEAKMLRELDSEFTAVVIAAEPEMSTNLMISARAAGLKVFLAPSARVTISIIENAELVVVHYWNCPSMYEFFKFLAVSPNARRLIVSIRVNGCTLPQAVPDWVNAPASGLIHLNRHTPVNAITPGTPVKTIPSIIRLPEELPPFKVPAAKTFGLFYAGAVNFFKVHPRLIEMHESLAINDYTFDLWGAGMDSAFEKAMVSSTHVKYRGFSRDIYATMEPYHLLCNPQNKLSYGSFDKIIKESQWMGKPAITLKEAYVADNIVDGLNGIVADDEAHYRAAITELATDPAAYKRLSESTAAYTRTNYKIVTLVQETFDLYKQVTGTQAHTTNAAPPPEQACDAAMDGTGKWRTALIDHPETLSSTEINYALRCEGGLIHFYKAYPEDDKLKRKIGELLELEKTREP